MKLKTVQKYINLLNEVKESGLSLSAYCKQNNISANSVMSHICELRKQNEIESEEVAYLLNLYNEVVTNRTKICSSEILDNDDVSETIINRDKDGKIINYEYHIFRKNKPTLCGYLTREEMYSIHRLYSWYGDNLQQRMVARYFTELSLIDLKRILRAFNITKASCPFPPHMMEECTEDELRDIQLRERENSFLRKAEEDEIRDTKKLLKKYAQENKKLKEQLENFTEFNISYPENIEPYILPEYVENGNNINLYLSDIHLGAAVTSGTMAKENINYGFDEAKRRLSECLKQLNELGTFDIINVILMGDNIDCCGVYGKTARLDHDMPENMDVREQGNKFIELIMWFISSLVNNGDLCSKIRIYSVPEGNHGGHFEYMCNKSLLNMINAKYPNIETTLWEDFFGIFEQSNHTFLIAHGKDAKYMKKGLPLNLDDKSRVKIYEYLIQNNINVDNIHIVKGDLHSNSINSCRRFTYRNVLSLFGVSDYSAYNFSANSYGISYDMFIGDNMISGTFENL